MNENGHIKKMKHLPFQVERNAFNYMYEEEMPIRVPTEPVERSFFDKAWDTIRLGWLALRVAPSTISTLFKVKVLNNDKKTTIVGWIKGILATAAAIFLPELTGAGEATNLIAQVILGAWGLFEIVSGWLTNKPETK